MKKGLFLAFLLLFPLFISGNSISASTKSRPVYEKTGRVVWEVNIKEKLVAITFDDGPHPQFTPQILDLLAKYHAKATFFVTGTKAAAYPDLLKREVKEGHEIGNHTFQHIYGKRMTSSKLSSELEETDKLIQKITGKKPILYRPVGGLYNDLIINTAIKNGKQVILWSWHQDTRDWANRPVSKICDNVTIGLKAGNIILFHDWHGTELSNKCQTVPALEKILDYLYKNGYKCVTVSELLYRSQQTIPDRFGIFPLKKQKASTIDLVI